MADVVNPYSVPKSAVADVGPEAEAEAVRQAHISTEASLRSVGLLYYLAFASCALGAIIGFATPGAATDGVGVGIGVAVVMLVLALIFAAMGYGLRGLKPWVRVPGIVLSIVGLLGFPVGTLINAYVLYLLFCAKGRYIFTPEYAAIAAATPHVRYRSSAIMRGLMIVLLIGIVAAIVVPMVAR